MEAPIILREHSTSVVAMPSPVAVGLASGVDDHVLTVRPSFEPGSFELRTGSNVGTITCSGAQILIKPKVPIRNVMAMLLPADAPINLDDAAFDYSRDSSITDVMATLFARATEELLLGGLRLGYREREEHLVALRGRVDHRRQMRSALPTPLACRFDEYTIDTDQHRMLKAAATAMLRFADVDRTTRSSLGRIVRVLDGAQSQGFDRPRIVQRGLNRLDSHYRVPLGLADLILSTASITGAAGNASASTFLFDMNAVFERFVGSRIRQFLPDGHELIEQFSTTLDEPSGGVRSGRVLIAPDLVVLRDGRPAVVADLKYIVPDHAWGKTNNLFQIVAYCDALGVDTGVLIYVAEPGAAEQEMVVRSSGKRISVVRVDLSRSRAEIDESIRYVAEGLVGTRA